MTHEFLDFTTLSAGDRYRFMANAITPRPIAWITTCNASDRANAAPFSFFGLLSHDPPTLALGIEPRPDGRRKDTARNILDTGAFTVHLSDVALSRAMDATAAPLEPEVDELSHLGIETVPGTSIPVPRIAHAPVALECRLLQSVSLGPARDVLLGTIVGMFVRSDAITAQGRVDQDILDIVGRVGDASYATTRDRFRV